MSKTPVCPKCFCTKIEIIEGDSGTTGGPDVRCLNCQWKGQPIVWVKEELAE